MRSKVTVLVVTYNRKQLLQECLSAILNQTFCPESIIVINNASTDDTETLFEAGGEFFSDKIKCVNMERNIGGSGGFYEGLKLSLDDDAEWVWIMDDDTVPNPECLEKLMDANAHVADKIGENHVSFYASSIFGTNGEFMNVPIISKDKAQNGYETYYEFLDKTLLQISSATFVSLLIRKDAIKKCGLPCKDYFIWGDDTEYTLRLTKNYGRAYMVGNSVAIHKRNNPSVLTLDTIDDPIRIRMFRYHIRNNVINRMIYRMDGKIIFTVLIRTVKAMIAIKYLRNKNGFLKLWTVWVGTFEGFIHYKSFRRYIIRQLQE